MKAVINVIATFILFGCTPSNNSEDQMEKNTIEVLPSPSGENSSLPFLSKDDDNNLLLSWVERISDTTNLKFSTLNGMEWSTPSTIASGSDWFVNWADYPSIARSGSRMISHFLAKSSAGTYSYDVHLTQSQDNGANWNQDFMPHSDGTPTEHGFATLMPFKNQFFVVWLDGRNTGGGHDEGPGGAMTIRGALISPSGEISNEVELDDRVCDCCQTGGAITENGPIIVYRDRSEEEIRDMSIVRLVDGAWTSPKTIYPDDWNIAGCPVNGPRASAVGSNLAVAWFSAAHQKSEVKVIFSSDNGATFGDVVMVDQTSPVGRVDVSMINENTAIISWLDKGTKNAIIKAVLLSVDGVIKKEFIVSETDPSRKSGFPQMEVIGDTVYFAWTELIEEETTVNTAFISLNI